MEGAMRPPRSLPEGSVERLAQALRGARSKAEFQRVQCVRQGEGLWEHPERGGRRHQNLTREEEAQLLKSFLPPAEQGGLLEVSRVKQAYEQAVGHVVPKSTVYRMLARHGWRKLAPPPRHPQADEARPQGFKKTFRHRLRPTRG